MIRGQVAGKQSPRSHANTLELDLENRVCESGVNTAYKKQQQQKSQLCTLKVSPREI